MLVNLSDVFSSEGLKVSSTVELEMTSFKSRMGDFRITRKTPVTLQLANIGVGKAKLEGEAELVYKILTLGWFCTLGEEHPVNFLDFFHG